MSTITRLATCALTLFLLFLTASPAQAVNVFSDDFENYADQAAFAATWTANGTPPHQLDTAFGRSSNQSLMLVPQSGGSGTSNRWYRDLGTPILASDAQPVRFSFDFYLDPAGAGTNWGSDWQLVDVRAFSGGAFGAGSLNGIVAMSVARNSTLNADTYNGVYFQGRILAPGHASQTYHTLDALPTAVQRSSGWHNMVADIGSTQTLFSIDGLAAEQVPFGLTTAICTIVLGSDISSIHPFWVDNVKLDQVPEPMMLGLLAPLATMLLARRRR
jgi:hypothetical protein